MLGHDACNGVRNVSGMFHAAVVPLSVTVETQPDSSHINDGHRRNLKQQQLEFVNPHRHYNNEIYIPRRCYHTLWHRWCRRHTHHRQ